MSRLVSEKDFLEAPVDYKTNFSIKFEELIDQYQDKLDAINRKIKNEEDRLRIIQVGIDKREMQDMVGRLNEFRPESREVLFIGRTIYDNPHYVVIVGPVSEREYFWCLNDIKL